MTACIPVDLFDGLEHLIGERIGERAAISVGEWQYPLHGSAGEPCSEPPFLGVDPSGGVLYLSSSHGE